MKKVLLLAVASVFVLASCAKDRTCECTTNGGTPQTVSYKKVTKTFMKYNADCVSKEYSYPTSSTTSVTVKEVCEIK